MEKSINYDTVVSEPPVVKIDHEFVDDVICPHCGHKFSDPWEFEDGFELDCYECEKPLRIVRHEIIKYSTRKE